MISNRNNMIRGKILILLVSLFISMGLCGCNSKDSPIVLNVYIPYSDNIQDPDSNYYIEWLEEKTGYDIEISVIRENRCEEYLKKFFSSSNYENANVDIIMFGEDFTPNRQTILEYAKSNLIEQRRDGSYYFPNSGHSVREGCSQVLWINSEWLSKLGLTIPQTTEELRSVLREFKNNDPNGNGFCDEIPLIGCNEEYYFNPCNFLINAFTSYDPIHCGIREDGTNAVCEDEFRDGLKYCRELFEEGLIDNNSFSYSESEFLELINSPGDFVGAFTTDSIGDAIYLGNTEIMAHYVHVPPLTGPDGACNAIFTVRGDYVGAIIPKTAPHVKEAEILLDTMLTEEASLIAGYGEEGVDWEYSDGIDVSIYGTNSTIVTKNYIWNSSQNKHLNGIGPMDIPNKYLKGVTWNGINSDTEYIDARAKMSYKNYLSEKISNDEISDELYDCVYKNLENFVSGRGDIQSDLQWNSFVAKAQNEKGRND